MKHFVIMLMSFFLLLSISGCTPKTIYIKVPQKCTIPDTEEPSIDNSYGGDIMVSAKRCAKNYTKMKEYADKLKVNSKVCQ